VAAVGCQEKDFFRAVFLHLQAVVAFTFLTGYDVSDYRKFVIFLWLPGDISEPDLVVHSTDNFCFYAYLFPLSSERDADSFLFEPADLAFHLSSVRFFCQS
jgi:hypothetical protein